MYPRVALRSFSATLLATLMGSCGDVGSMANTESASTTGTGPGSTAESTTDTESESTGAPIDTEPPTGTIQINDGAESTSQTAVTLTLSASDEAGEVVEMRLSNDGETYNAPIVFAANAPWTLTSGSGEKTVFVQYRDDADNWSDAFADSIQLEAGSSSSPALGAHVLLAQNEFAGSNPAVTPSITTQVEGSTLLAFSMGWLQNLSMPVDSYDNVWSQISDTNIYFSEDFYTAVFAVPVAVGGPGHTLSFDKLSYPAGEISMGMIEVVNGGDVSLVYDYAPSSNQTPGSLSVDGPATLIAIWSGDAYAFDHTAVPDNEFTVIDSYLDFGEGDETAVQVAVAVKEVDAPGTYTVQWTSTPAQMCACYLIAVQGP